MAYDNLFLIKSVDRSAESKSSSDFFIDMIHPVDGLFECVNILIPSTAYQFDSNLTTNEIYFYDSADRTAVITPGNYTNSDLPAEVKAAMEAVSTITFTVTIDTNTSKMTIAGNSAFIIKFASNDGARILLGFDAADTTSDTTHTGNNVVDLAYPRSMIVEINDNAGVSTTANGMGTLYMPVSVNSSDMNLWTQNSFYRQFITFNSTTRISIKLKNSSNQALSLNGSDFEIFLRKVPNA